MTSQEEAEDLGVGTGRSIEDVSRIGVVAEECLEALAHLRRAAGHAGARDAFMSKLIATMQQVADLSDDVEAALRSAPSAPGADSGPSDER